MMDRPRWLAVYRSVPYALTWLGLVGGLVVLVFAPFPSAAVNYLVGGVLLAVAVGSVTLLIIEHSGPGERGPDF